MCQLSSEQDIGGMEMHYRKGEGLLSRQEREWAYIKWCEGYTQYQIGEALHCSHKTVARAIHGKPRIRPILVYPGEEAKT